MKRYKISHTTEYKYNQPVQLHTHSVRVRPKESHELRIESSMLKITPEPSLRWCRDVEDNCVALLDFTGESKSLVIQSVVVVQQYNSEPLDFLVEPYALYVPFAYSTEEMHILREYLETPSLDKGIAFKQWAAPRLNTSVQMETYAFLTQLCEAIKEEFSYTVREEEGVQSPDVTVLKGSGSCRDFAYLFIACARFWGVASRFVSGYLHSPSGSGIPGATHAWAECYIPGAGWKGFDPTTGFIVGDDHFPVAVSHDPSRVPPVAGKFFGTAGSSLKVGVFVDELIS